MSKYLSSANDNKKRENKEINIDGIRVNNAKKVIYFLFAFDPLTSTSIFNEELTSLKIIKKSTNNKDMLPIKSNWRFRSVNSRKPLSMKVKKVKKPRINEIKKKRPINIFFLINSIIMR